MKKERTIELIKKVLNKTKNNNNENEVEIALMKAQELMIKHGISMEEVDIEEKKQEAKMDIVDGADSNWYREMLGSVISKNFRCEVVLSRVFNKGKYRNKLSFIGLEEDLSIAKEVYNFTITSIEYFANNYIKLIKYKDLTEDNIFKPAHYTGIKNDFIRGFIKGLEDKYKKQVEDNGWGLIVVKPVEVEEFISGLNMGKGRKRSTINSAFGEDHYNNGFKEGNNFEHRKDLIV